MPTKKSNPKSGSMNISWKNILIGVSIFFNILFLILIIAFISGSLNWWMANYSIDNLTDSKGCFLAQDNSVKQDSSGRAINIDGKVVCLQSLNPGEVK